jgi:DNA-binding GntR family transcriptional regulator
VLGSLRSMADHMRSAVETGDLDAYYQMAAAFHDALVAGSGNRILGRLHAQIRLQLRRYQMFMSGVPDSPTQSILEHDQLLACIREGRVDEAGRLAREHIRALVLRFRALDAQTPGRTHPATQMEETPR